MNKRVLSPDLTILRYAGDLAHVATLTDDYGALETIGAIELEHRLRGKHPWDAIVADTIPLSPSLVPRIHSLLSGVCDKVGLSCTTRLFASPSPQINAYAFLDRCAHPPILSMCLTARAMEELTDCELLFLMGHELGHIVYEHNRINLLCHTSDNAPGATVLPFMGEWTFLRWRQNAEISADRVGWLVAGRSVDGAGAIIKAATGLTGRSLVLDPVSIRAYLQEAPVSHPHVKRPDCHRAPLLPGRLGALYLLAEATPADYRFGNRRPAWLQKVDVGVDEILGGLSRHPDSALAHACMNLIADAGLQLVQGDNSIIPDEVKKVLDIIHCHYSDQPDKVLEMDTRKRVVRIKSTIRILNQSGTTKEKHEVLSRLADIAIVDGCFLEKEGRLVLDLAASLHIPQAETYSIIVGCIQDKGRSVDPALLSLSRALA